ncbi:MAG: EamA family transporter [Candidatus Delongbacteria bacterium]|nr:EamA family transporter [Candidatus Delongbacteria bacterium]
MTRDHQANIYLLLTIFWWSTVAAVFKLVLRRLPVADLLLLATLTSTLLLWVLLLARGGRVLLRQQSSRELALSALQGALNPVLYYLVLFNAYKLLPAQQAQPLNFTWPLMLMLLSVPLLKQQLTWRKMLALVVSYTGVLLVVTRGNLVVPGPGELSGVVLALSSTGLWALFWLLNLRDQRDDLLKLAMAFSWGSLYLVCALPFRGMVELPALAELGGAFYIGLFEMGFTFFFWLRALSLARNPALPLNAIYLTPFISLIWIHQLVGEQIHYTAILGLLLIVLGIVLQRSAPAVSVVGKRS